MAKANYYTVKDLKKQFPTDDVCLDFIYAASHSRQCSCGGTYKRIKGRKQYQCSKCRYQIAPTAGTIFHKSDTPLTDWFHALFIFSNAKSGISAKELQRHLGCTYKTAWRILNQIRKALGQNGGKLGGDVEMDTAYFGGRGKGGKNNERQSLVMREKSTVMGAVQRGGKARLTVVGDAKVQTINTFLDESVSKEALLMTDSASTYKQAGENYKNLQVNHSKNEYAWDRIHTNTVESLFGHIKRSVRGTHKTISKKYLQNYLDGFVFHYDNRHNDSLRFAALLERILHGAG